jgi:protein-L-isoaspartate(D-aspartate) O-methyltransferase
MKPMSEEHFSVLRRHMVEVIEIHADLSSDETGRSALSERVLEAMHRVPRHRFVPDAVAPYAYQDMPLPIGFDKTISQPFIVAIMTDLLDPQPEDSVLEIGTGLGYQAAILGELAGQVWSVEVIEEFARQAEATLRHLGLTNVAVHIGDGSRGWAEHAPFDRIIVTAAPVKCPPALLEQLKPGGRMVLPLGAPDAQRLTVVEKDSRGRCDFHQHIPVRFSELETVR